MTEAIKSRGHEIKGVKYAIRYTDLAEVIDSSLAWLEQLWGKVLPYEYMDFRCTILNTRDTTIFSYEDDWGVGVFGHPTKSESLIFKDILPKEHDPSLLTLEVLRWVANCYGLVLQSKLDRTGSYARPVQLR